MIGLARDELIVDLFCGGGGASEGICWGTGRDPDYAVNHSAEAVAMHAANHMSTVHLKGDVHHYKPRSVVGSRRVGLLWASPTCTYFSQAKGAALDVEEATKIRALADVVIDWARDVRPRVIMVENVGPFQKWGPLLPNGKACPEGRGTLFAKWIGELRAEGYEVEWRELVACDYGAPTSRKRLFIIARCDGEPIVWPEPTHGPPSATNDGSGPQVEGSRLTPYRTASECIDWSIPCPSIFDRKKPLVPATLRRIARGIQRFVIDAAEPFLVPTRHTSDARIYPIHEPMRTVTASNRGELALVVPSLVHVSNGERPGQAPRIYDIQKPLTTVVAGGVKHGLVTAFLAKNFGGHESRGADLRMPMSTVTCRDHHSLVTAFLTQYNGQSIGQRLDVPMNTITTRDRFALVTVHGEKYTIADIGMRLLEPRELYRAQGFPDTYVIDRWSKTAQIRMAGNSVPPHLACALVRANLTSRNRSSRDDTWQSQAKVSRVA